MVTNNASALVPSTGRQHLLPRSSVGTTQDSWHSPTQLPCSHAVPLCPGSSSQSTCQPPGPLSSSDLPHLSCSVSLRCRSLKSLSVLSYILRWSLFVAFWQMGWNQTRSCCSGPGTRWQQPGQGKDGGHREKVTNVRCILQGELAELADRLVMKVRNPVWFLASGLSNWRNHGATYCHRNCWGVGSWIRGREIKRLFRHVNFAMFQTNITGGSLKMPSSYNPKFFLVSDSSSEMKRWGKIISITGPHLPPSLDSNSLV